MYRKFDEDADGILSFMETNKFMVATGNKPFNENQWQAVCKMAGGANPDSGLTVRIPLPLVRVRLLALSSNCR